MTYGGGWIAATLSGVAAYYRALWSGHEPLAEVIVNDMLIGGTLINVSATGIALLLFGNGAPRWLAATVFFAAFPYSLFLLIVVWRTAEKSASPWAVTGQILAVVWFAATLIT